MKKILIISLVLLFVAGIIFSWSLFFNPKNSWKKGLPKNVVEIAETALASKNALSMWSLKKCVKEKNVVYLSMYGNLNGGSTFYDANGIKIASSSQGDWGDEIIGETFDLSGYQCELVIR